MADVPDPREARARLQDFVEQYACLRGVDPDMPYTAHGIVDRGPAPLRISDLRAVLAALDAENPDPAPQPAADSETAGTE